MSMTKNNLLIAIIESVGEMSEDIKDAKIKENYLEVTSQNRQLHYKYLLEAFKWLQNIYRNEHKEVRRIKALCPKQVWKNYELMGCDELEEVIMLKKALQDFRKVVVSRNKPIFFIRSKVDGIIRKAAKARAKVK